MKTILFIIIGSLLMIDGQTKEPNRRHLNAAAAESTLSFSARLHGGELRASEVPSSATLRDVYQIIGATVGIVGSLGFEGHRLPNDEGTLAVDAGICGECVIDVFLPNDLQILDKAIRNPNKYLWPRLVTCALMPKSEPEDVPTEVRRAFTGIDDYDATEGNIQNYSYDQFEAAAHSLSMNVMELAEKYCNGWMISVKNGKIVAVDAFSHWNDGEWRHQVVDVNLALLAQLTELTKLEVHSRSSRGIDLSALGTLRRLKSFELSFSRHKNDEKVPETRSIMIPDMSKCTQLERILIWAGRSCSLLRLVGDCSQSKLEQRQIKTRDGNFELNW